MLALLNLDLYIAFIPVMIALLIIPGPTLALITLNTAQKGRRAGLNTVMGVAAGKTLLALLVIGLLTTVLALVEAYGDWMRWFGAAFLMIIAVRAWRTSDQTIERSETARSRHSGTFLQGFFVAATSPMTLLFLATQFPAFIDPELTAGPQLALLGITYLASALVIELTCVGLIVMSATSNRREASIVFSSRGSAVCLFGIAAFISPLSASIGV